MPVSKNRKNHKQKVQAWKKKKVEINNRFNNELRKAIEAKNNPTLENGEMRLEIE